MKIIEIVLRNRVMALVVAAGVLAAGGFSWNRLPIDAFPDVTNTQVMVLTQAPGLSTGEVELFPQGRSTLGTERKGRGQMAPLLTETALRPRDAMLGQSGASDMMWNAGKVPAAAILIRFLPVKKQP